MLVNFYLPGNKNICSKLICEQNTNPSLSIVHKTVLFTYILSGMYSKPKLKLVSFKRRLSFSQQDNDLVWLITHNFCSMLYLTDLEPYQLVRNHVEYPMDFENSSYPHT